MTCNWSLAMTDGAPDPLEMPGASVAPHSHSNNWASMRKDLSDDWFFRSKSILPTGTVPFFDRLPGRYEPNLEFPGISDIWSYAANFRGVQSRPALFSRPQEIDHVL